MLTSLMYRSQLNQTPTEDVLKALANVSIANNRKNDISGLLLTAGTEVLQILEGPTQSLVPTVDKIRSDDRHTNFVSIYMGPIQWRYFPGWHMMNEVLVAGAADAIRNVSTPAGVFEPISEYLSPDVHKRLKAFMSAHILDPLAPAA